MSSGSHSPFRFLFWGLAAVLVLSYGGIVTFTVLPRLLAFRPLGPFWFPLPLLHQLPLILMVVVAAVIGTVVYRDAAARGMDPWLWATVAVFVPALIGLVIYLIVRSNPMRTCPKCGRTLRQDFRLCPYCGHVQEAHCPQCQTAISEGWRLCPQCGQSLHPEASGAGSGQQPEG
jgi:RNA polymerase subunit RPABC4/transcription elongation factor Spt4